MKLIIAGSRTFTNFSFLKYVLDSLKLKGQITVISGTARGADQMGEQWAALRGHTVVRMPANWGAHGRSAGYKRNKEMAKVATHCICFWDGKSKGTKHMIDLAREHKLYLRVFTQWAGLANE